ncbi:MAG: Flp pilus assembly protein CpaB [Bryobacteraceae bacterium]
MKRNLFPFLGIAFVVAIAATGVFYGLFVGKISGAAPVNPAGYVVVSHAVERGMVLTAADVKLKPAGPERPEGAFGSVEEVVGRTAAKPLASNEPVTAPGLVGAKGAAQLAIPKGMRAISVHVADSAGLVPYLRAGDKIDVQSIHTLNSGERQVRTLLSSVEVLNVHVDPTPQPGTVLNLLVPARDVERVALADSAAKVRIVLRNAEDSDELPTASAVTAAAVPRVNFQVRMAAAPAATVGEIASLSTGGNGALRIGLLPMDWKPEAALRMLSTESADSPQWQEVSVQAGGTRRGEYSLRLRLTARAAAKGMLRVQVRPELTMPERGGVTSRRFSADLNVAEGQSFVVAGFERDASAPELVERLFQSQPAGTELLLLVTPRVAAAR